MGYAASRVNRLLTLALRLDEAELSMGYAALPRGSQRRCEVGRDGPSYRMGPGAGTRPSSDDGTEFARDVGSERAKITARSSR